MSLEFIYNGGDCIGLIDFDLILGGNAAGVELKNAIFFLVSKHAMLCSRAVICSASSLRIS